MKRKWESIDYLVLAAVLFAIATTCKVVIALLKLLEVAA